MKTLDQWLSEYSESHQNKTNKAYHQICVPLIFWSVVAFLTLIPLGPISAILPVSLLAMTFYFRLGLKPGALMSLLILAMISVSDLIQHMTGHLLEIAVVVFVLAWIGQFIGHNIEGKKPSFFQDLQFLLIGPLWIFGPKFFK